MPSNSKYLGLLLAASFANAFAQPVTPVLQPAVRETTADGYRERLNSLSALVRACRNDASACNSSAVGDDNKVVGEGDTYQVRWEWLRTVLADARNPKSQDRDAALEQAASRLDSELADTGKPAQTLSSIAPARQAANAILARPEFRAVAGESWLDRKVARFWAWFYSLFTAASDLGRHAPWLRQTLEWGFVGVAFAVVLVWVARTMRRERLAISLGAQIQFSGPRKESDDWAMLARREAETKDWRAAIHCLYWASIVELESRGVWRRDPARTPREYLNLLQPGSNQERNLRSITGIFERIWYGIRAAGHEDYEQALQVFDEIRRV
jgi:hypothetical protein